MGPSVDILPVAYHRAEFGSVVRAFLCSFDHLHREGVVDESRVLHVT